jgi:mannosyltransferase OCH1-like enzyme
MYYINLERSVGRNNFIKKQISRYDLNMTRIDGVDGYNLSLSNGEISLTPDKKISFINKYTANSQGELGCTLSHLKAIYTAYMNGDEIAVIMEDDISFVLYPFWPTTLQYIANNAPKDWSVINLYTIACNNSSSHFESFNVNKPCFGALAYLINRKGMENVLQDIIKFDKIILDSGYNFNGPNLVADMIIYHRSGNAYDYFEYPTFVPYNDTKLLNSTIHIDHTIMHVKRALSVMEKYIIKTKGKMYIRKCWKSDRKIPKIIHLLWYKSNTDKPSNDIKKMLEMYQKLYPGFIYEVWDDERARNLIKTEFQWFLSVYDSYDTPKKKINAIRYFILFYHGGVYMDVDTICLKNISKLFENGKAVFRYRFHNTEKDDSICDSLMLSPSKHPLFENIIYFLKDFVHEEVSNATGPIFLTNQIKNYTGNDISIHDMS